MCIRDRFYVYLAGTSSTVAGGPGQALAFGDTILAGHTLTWRIRGQQLPSQNIRAVRRLPLPRITTMQQTGGNPILRVVDPRLELADPQLEADATGAQAVVDYLNEHFVGVTDSNTVSEGDGEFIEARVIDTDTFEVDILIQTDVGGTFSSLTTNTISMLYDFAPGNTGGSSISPEPGSNIISSAANVSTVALVIPSLNLNETAELGLNLTGTTLRDDFLSTLQDIDAITSAFTVAGTTASGITLSLIHI